MELVASFLLLFDLDCPETLDTLFLLLFGWLFDLGHTEGKQREGEELEGVFGAGAIRDFGQEGVLLAGFLVCRRVEGANGTFD